MRAFFILSLLLGYAWVAHAQAGELANDSPLPAEYSVTFRLMAEEQLIQESELDFIEGLPASVITQQWRGQMDPAAGSPEFTSDTGALILAGTAGCEWVKPEQLSATTWAGFWRSAEHLQLGALEFHIYDPRARRIEITASRAAASADASPTTGPAGKQWEYYGELEAPLSCPPLEAPSYICRIEGFSEGRLVRQGEFGLLDTPSSSVYQLCGPEDEGDGLAGVWPSCLLVILPTARCDHPLAWHVDKALGGLVEPPLDIAQLGPFELHYYYPESDKLVFSLWELDGEWHEDWEADTPLSRRITLTNHQPPPPE